MSDTNQWIVQVEGAAPPPEIPWLVIGGAVAVVAGLGIIVLIRRK